jgi:hypothetical protein
MLWIERIYMEIPLHIYLVPIPIWYVRIYALLWIHPELFNMPVAVSDHATFGRVGVWLRGRWIITVVTQG